MLYVRHRWIIVGVFVLSTSINMLDRQVFAALAPTIKRALGISSADYGVMISAFGLAYATCAPVSGWLIDRVGLGFGLSLAVGLWSLSGMVTGFARSLGSLVGCRAMLGVGESAGMPALAKTNAIYLPPSEFTLSLAVNNIALTLGSSGAPLLVATIAPVFGWRAVFIFTGAAGLLWIPLWILVSRHEVPVRAGREPCLRLHKLLEDPRLWGLIISNALIMTVYTVWSNWTTLYFVKQLHLDEIDANRHYVWIPPIGAMLGGFFGGWLSYRWINRGMDPAMSRLRGSWLAATFILVTAFIPLISSAVWATIAISTAMFWAMSLQMNVHILPVDIFGSEWAGRTVSALAASYGLMQMFVSPVIGAVIDRYGFSAVCLCLSVLPLLGVWVLKVSVRVTRPIMVDTARRLHV